MARILRASPKEVEAHNRIRHDLPKHHACPGECLWGFANPKHAIHSGGVGRPARRKRLAMAAKYRKVEKKEKR